MRRFIGLAVLPVAAVWIVLVAHQAWSFPAYAVKTDAACAACHTNPAGGASLTEAGQAYAKDPATAKLPAATKTDYVGSGKCKLCHSKQYKAWGETPHAHAFEVLEKGDAEAVAAMSKALGIEVKESPAKTDGCVTCHVTGMGLSGGYPGADADAKAILSNVTCESCHGPGGAHVKAAKDDRKKTINGAVSAKMCTQCHTSATSPKFDFDTYKAKGVHNVPKAE